MRTCATESGYFVSIPDRTGGDFAQGFYRVRRYWQNTTSRKEEGE